MDNIANVYDYNFDYVTKYLSFCYSYGTSWGIRGYMRMVRNVNMCGIATDAGFPLV